MPETNLNIVRAGITIYGIYPSSEVERDIVKLEPVMELKSHVTYVKDVPAGAAISYGGTYVADRSFVWQLFRWAMQTAIPGSFPIKAGF